MAQREQLVRHFDTYGDGTVDYKAYMEQVKDLTKSREKSKPIKPRADSSQTESTGSDWRIRTKNGQLPGPRTQENQYMDMESTVTDSVVQKCKNRILHRAKGIPRFIRACSDHDRDQDNCLSQDEFGRVLSRMGISLGRTTFTKLASSLDSQNKGVIPIEAIEKFLTTSGEEQESPKRPGAEEVEQAYNNIRNSSGIRRAGSVDPVLRHLNSLDKGQTGKLPLVTLTYALRQHGIEPNSRYLDTALRYLNVNKEDPSVLVPYKSFVNAVQRKIEHGTVGEIPTEPQSGHGESALRRQEGIHDSKVWQKLRGSRNEIISKLKQYPGRKVSYKDMDRCLTEAGVALSDEDMGRVVSALDQTNEGKVDLSSVYKRLFPEQKKSSDESVTGAKEEYFQDQLTGQPPWWVHKETFWDKNIMQSKRRAHRSEFTSTTAHLPHMNKENHNGDEKLISKSPRKKDIHEKLYGSRNVQDALTSNSSGPLPIERSRSRTGRVQQSQFTGTGLHFVDDGRNSNSATRSKSTSRAFVTDETTSRTKGTYSFSQPYLSAGTGVDEKQKMLLDLYRQHQDRARARYGGPISDSTTIRQFSASHAGAGAPTPRQTPRLPPHPPVSHREQPTYRESTMGSTGWSDYSGSNADLDFTASQTPRFLHPPASQREQPTTYGRKSTTLNSDLSLSQTPQFSHPPAVSQREQPTTHGRKSATMNSDLTLSQTPQFLSRSESVPPRPGETDGNGRSYKVVRYAHAPH